MAANLDVTVNNSQALKALDQISSKLSKIGSDFDTAFSRASGAAAALTATLVGLGAATARFADEISDVAAANDTTIASVLGLSKALDQAGGKGENVGRMFQTLANNIEAANGGNEKTVKNFQKLGVSFSDLAQASQSDINGTVIKSLAAMQDSTERNAIAMQIFGKAAVGVDFKKLASEVDDNVSKYEQFAPALGTAGDAFDKINSILGDLKVAFAVAFEPIFAYILRLKVEIPDLVKGFNYLAVALAALTSAAVIGGLIKIVDLLKVMSVVVSKNPLIAIAGALLSIGAGAAAYFGITKAQEEAQVAVTEATKKTGDEVKKVSRDQGDLLDKRKKELDSILKIRSALEANFKTARDKYDLELLGLGLNETQKKILQEQGDIEKQTQQSLLSLKQANDALSTDAQARNRTAYEAERTAIIQNGETQKKYSAERINQLRQQEAQYKSFVESFRVFGDAEQKLLEISIASKSQTASISERIDLENKLLFVQKSRANLMSNMKDIAKSEQMAAQQAIDEAVLGLDLEKSSYNELTSQIYKNIQARVQEGQISQSLADQIVANTGNIQIAIATSSNAIAKAQQKVAEQQRTFSSGWKKAFNDYADSATNAATRAQRIFEKFTTGIEDAIVNFVKTGRFEFRSFVESMAEELLRSQIKQTIAGLGKAFGLGDLFGGGGGALGDSPSNPLYVVDISGGGGGGGGIIGGTSVAGGGGGGIFDTIGNVFGGVKDAVGGVFDGISNAVGGIVDTIGGIFGGGGGGGGIFDSIGDLFSGFFANGGMIPQGRFGIAGEAGPEFIGGPASVTPMSGTNVTYNIQAVDAASFQALVARDPAFIHAVAQAGARTIPARR